MGLWMVVGGWVALLECLCECVLEGVGGKLGHLLLLVGTQH